MIQNHLKNRLHGEYEHLQNADIIIFWFSRGSLNPIVLYELGKWGNSTNEQIIIGIDPEYERANDIKIQTMLARPDVFICDSLKSLVYYTKICLIMNKIDKITKKLNTYKWLVKIGSLKYDNMNYQYTKDVVVSGTLGSLVFKRFMAYT
jgi:hypothetical protein